MNLVYKVRETRPYWKAHGSAILVTILLAVIATIDLAVMLAGDALAHRAHVHIWHRPLSVGISIAIHIVTWLIATALLMLIFSTIYYYAPDLKKKCWHWLTPGAAFGILTWMLASFGLRAYLHFFNTYSVTYGSLGAVVILLMWFYITGLTLLTGAELNSEIQASVAEKRLKQAGTLPPEASADPDNPVPLPVSVTGAFVWSHLTSRTRHLDDDASSFFIGFCYFTMGCKMSSSRAGVPSTRWSWG